MKVGLLTIEQKEELVGQKYSADSYFYPVQDGNTPPNWIISTQEMDGCIYPEFDWVKSLPLIDWVEPEYTDNYVGS